MIKQAITDNPVEVITIGWDGERFSLFRRLKGRGSAEEMKDIILLNPREAKALIPFIQTHIKALGGKG